jgi:hypothetical protein
MADRRVILVENTEDRVHCVADLQLRTSPAIKATFGAPQPPNDALLPGVNEVYEDEWVKAEKIPIVKGYIETGVFKVRRQASDITSLSPKDAVEIVKATVDEGLLSKWFETEKRKQVLEAIDAQLDAIKVPEQDKATSK